MRRLRTAISGGVCIDGVRMLGVMRIGVKRCETRDSMAGELFSRLTTVYEFESSRCILVRNELSLVVESCGLYCEHDDRDLDLSRPLNIYVFRQQFSYCYLAFHTC